MSEWESVRIADEVDIQIGGTPSRIISSFWAKKPAGTPWIAISDLKSKFVVDTAEYITDRGAQFSNVKMIPVSSTVMSFKLSVGRIGIVTRPMYCNEAIAIFLPRSERVNSRWLYHALPRAAGTVVTDTAVKGATLNKAKMAEMALNLPMEAEQISIAQVLDTLDTTIHQTEAIVEKLKQVKQGLLHDLLTRGVGANGELRPSHEQAPELYQASPLGWIPKEWESSSVEAEFFVDSGITLGQHRVPRHKPRPYLRVANVHRLKLRLKDVAFLEASDSEAAQKSLQQGDLLVVEGHASTEEIGRCAMANQEVSGFLFQNHLFRLRPKSLLNTYALLWMNSDFARAYWRTEAATSSGLNTINRTKLNNLSVAVPSNQEQELIAIIIGNMDERIHEEESSLEKFRSQKSGLMDDLLTGRVRVTPLLEAAP